MLTDPLHKLQQFFPHLGWTIIKGVAPCLDHPLADDSKTDAARRPRWGVALFDLNRPATVLGQATSIDGLGPAVDALIAEHGPYLSAH